MKHVDIRLTEDELFQILVLAHIKRAEAEYNYEKFGDSTFKKEEKFFAKLEKKLESKITFQTEGEFI